VTVERGDVTARRNNGRKRPKGYADWSPQAPARALLGQVEEILAEYADHLPLSVRQIFYRLVGRFDYEKTENAYERLSDKLVRARRARLIDFDAIRDDGVVTIPNRWYGGIEDFHDESARRARSYRRDRQAGQPVRIELWCEAAGMLGQLERVAQHYSVTVYSAGGFGSLTANYEIAERALEIGSCRPCSSTSATSTRPASRSSPRCPRTPPRSSKPIGSLKRWRSSPCG